MRPSILFTFAALIHCILGFRKSNYWIANSLAWIIHSAIQQITISDLLNHMKPKATLARLSKYLIWNKPCSKFDIGKKKISCGTQGNQRHAPVGLIVVTAANIITCVAGIRATTTRSANSAKGHAYQVLSHACYTVQPTNITKVSTHLNLSQYKA